MTTKWYAIFDIFSTAVQVNPLNPRLVLGKKNIKRFTKFPRKFINILSLIFHVTFYWSHLNKSSINIPSLIRFAHNELLIAFCIEGDATLQSLPETFSIYSYKFFHNFHLSESSFTCTRASDKWVSVKTDTALEIH